MKVSELIAKLQEYPGDLDVIVSLGEDLSYDEYIAIVCEDPMVYSGLSWDKRRVVNITN